MQVNRKLAAVLAIWTAFYPVFFEMAKARADDIISNAQNGQNEGIKYLGKALSIPSVDPTSDPTDAFHSNESEILVREIIPGADWSRVTNYKDTFDNPNSLQQFTKQEMLNIKGSGCELVHFEKVESKLVAWVWPIKMKKVIETDPITGNDVEKYVPDGAGTFLNQWMYLDNGINYKDSIPSHFPTIPTLGAAQETKDFPIKQLSSDTSLIYRWVYQPFAFPADGSYFVYNHQVVFESSAVINDGKNLSNRYHFSGRVLPQPGSAYVAFYADLYRVVRNYLDPDVVGFPCPPPYPAGSFIDGVDIVSGGVDFSDILTQRESKIYNQGIAYDSVMKSHELNREDPYSAEIMDIAAKATGFSSFTEIEKIFSGCTEDPQIQWGKKTAHQEDIFTCTSIRDVAMDAGCSGERKTRFSYVQTKEVLKISSEWLGRDCAKEGSDLYTNCTTITCPNAANSAYSSCTSSCDSAYTTCIDGGGDAAACASDRTSCKNVCAVNRSDALGACPSNCAVKRDNKIQECTDWNAANVGPYDMSGRVWTLSTQTVGGSSYTNTIIEDVPPSKVKYTIEVKPYGGSPMTNFSYDHKIYGASGSVTHYGGSTNNWRMSGNAVASGSEFTVEADIYSVNDNYIDGCQDYLMYLADGMCVEWQRGDLDCSSGTCKLINPSAVDLTCTDDRSMCTTLDGVTFCDGSGPASGVTELLPRWGWDKVALRNTPDSCASGEAGPPVEFLPQLCWKATGGPLDCTKLYTGLGECWTDPQGDVQCVDSSGGVNGTNYSPAGYKDDCDAQGYPARDDCKLVATNVCKDCAEGVASGTCYAYSIEWDCGVDMDYDAPASITFKQSCSSTAMRCMGTECHNTGGERNEDMLRAMAALEMLDHIRSDLVCEETGDPPVNTTDPCTLRVFNGTHQTCKVPIGHQLGLTPNCCEEGAAAAAGIDALAYLQLIYYSEKLGLFDAVIESVGGMGQLPGLTEVFDKLSGVQQAISQTLLPAESPLSGIANELEKGWAQMLVDNTGLFGEAIMGIMNQLAAALNSFLTDLFGSAFADSIITTGTFNAATGQWTTLPSLGPFLTFLSSLYLAYQILKIIGHLVFKCEEDELQLGIERKVGNCHYVGDYCAKDTFLGCVQSNDSYCCFSSPLSRIIHEQVRKQQSLAVTPKIKRKGYKSAKHPRCKGLTMAEMSAVDWDQIDLDEWISRLQDAGLHPTTSNPEDFIGIK